MVRGGVGAGEGALFKLGDRVEVQFSDKKWYAGKVAKSKAGEVQVVFDDGEIHDIRRDFAGTRFERTGQPKPKGKAAAVAAAPRAQARSAARGQRGAQSARTSGASSPAALAPLAPEPGADSSPEAHAGSKRPLPEEEGRRSSGAFSEALGADGEEGDEGSVKSQDDILAGSKRPLPEEEGGEEEGDGTYSEPRGAAGRGGRVSGRPQKDGKEASGKGKGTQKKGKESKADKSAPKTLQIGDVVEVRFNDWFPGTLDKFVATQGWWKVVFEDGSPWFIKEVPGPVVRMLPLPGEEGRPPKPGDAVECQFDMWWNGTVESVQDQAAGLYQLRFEDGEQENTLQYPGEDLVFKHSAVDAPAPKKQKTSAPTKKTPTPQSAASCTATLLHCGSSLGVSDDDKGGRAADVEEFASRLREQELHHAGESTSRNSILTLQPPARPAAGAGGGKRKTCFFLVGRAASVADGLASLGVHRFEEVVKEKGRLLEDEWLQLVDHTRDASSQPASRAHAALRAQWLEKGVSYAVRDLRKGSGGDKAVPEKKRTRVIRDGEEFIIPQDSWMEIFDGDVVHFVPNAATGTPGGSTKQSVAYEAFKYKFSCKGAPLKGHTRASAVSKAVKKAPAAAGGGGGGQGVVGGGGVWGEGPKEDESPRGTLQKAAPAPTPIDLASSEPETTDDVQLGSGETGCMEGHAQLDPQFAGVSGAGQDLMLVDPSAEGDGAKVPSTGDDGGGSDVDLAESLLFAGSSLQRSDPKDVSENAGPSLVASAAITPHRPADGGDSVCFSGELLVFDAANDTWLVRFDDASEHSICLSSPRVRIISVANSAAEPDSEVVKEESAVKEEGLVVKDESAGPSEVVKNASAAEGEGLMLPTDTASSNLSHAPLPGTRVEVRFDSKNEKALPGDEKAPVLSVAAHLGTLALTDPLFGRAAQ